MGNKSIYSVGNDAAITGKVQRKVGPLFTPRLSPVSN